MEDDQRILHNPPATGDGVIIKKSSGGKNMIIGDKKLEQLKRMPAIETTIKKSSCGRFIINQTTITDIKPVNYFQAVLGCKAKE